MKAPFPFFGGKSRAADLIWSRFGDPVNYVEPFAGSLAVLLSRPSFPFASTRVETANDIDCYVSNFWRAIEHDPEAVAAAADCPVFECDLHARHNWLHQQVERMERLKTEPDYFDARVAGYWAWGLSSWIGGNFCRPTKQESLPHLGPGRGVNRQLPHLGNSGMGVPGGCQDRRERLLAYFAQIADRLRGVRVCCGDWRRILGPVPIYCMGPTAILLDPPYNVEGTDYGQGRTNISTAVREWAITNGEHPDMKIALCGYVDEGHTEVMPVSWECVARKSQGGYNNMGDGRNRRRERIWFSPGCVVTEKQDSFL